MADANNFGMSLHTKCLIIGYMYMVSCVLEIGFHIVVSGIVSNWFSCELTRASIRQVDWPWVEYVLIIVTLGTHGCFPYPFVLRGVSLYAPYSFRIYSSAICYPGMMHVCFSDVGTVSINFIWLFFVSSYINALKKKDIDGMNLFIILCGVKVTLQTIYFVYDPTMIHGYQVGTYCLLKIVDNGIAAAYLYIMRSYTNFLTSENKQQAMAPPPPPPPPRYEESYVEPQKCSPDSPDSTMADIEPTFSIMTTS